MLLQIIIFKLQPSPLDFQLSPLKIVLKFLPTQPQPQVSVEALPEIAPETTETVETPSPSAKVGVGDEGCAMECRGPGMDFILWGLFLFIFCRGGGFTCCLFSSLFGEDFPIWLIFLRCVETTNQLFRRTKDPEMCFYLAKLASWFWGNFPETEMA